MFPTRKVEIAVGIGSGGYLMLDDPAFGLLDTGTLGPDLVWSDITERVISCKTRTPARSRALQAYNAGTVSILADNTDSALDPDNTSGPYAAAGVSGLYGARPVRVTDTWDGVEYPAWYGYSDGFRPQRSGPASQTCELTATDGFKLFGRRPNRAAQSLQGAGELSGARIQRILDDAGWPANLRDIDAGWSTLQATTLAGNLLAELQLVAASEGGALFVDRAGKLVFRDRYALFTRTRSHASQALFGEAPLDPGELHLVDVTPGYDDSTLINRVELARAGGTIQLAEDQTSQALYSAGMAVAWGRSDLLNESDTEIADAAGWVLAQHSVPRSRIDQFMLAGVTDPDGMWPTILELQLQDLVTVTRRPRNMAPIARKVFVDTVEHDVHINDSGVTSWTTRLTTTPADQHQGFVVLDDPDLALLDTARLAY